MLSGISKREKLFISPPTSPAGRKCEVPGSKSFFCPELVPGSKRLTFLPGTKNVDISCSIWQIFIKEKNEMYLESEPTSIYANRK